MGKAKKKRNMMREEIPCIVFLSSNENKDEELASLLCIGIKEVGYFVIQFNIFDSMGSCCDNKYVNYFYKINIITCELVELEHEKDTFIKAIIVFIRGRMQERNKFRLTIHNIRAFNQ